MAYEVKKATDEILEKFEKSKYPFDKMEIEEYFEFDAKEKPSVSVSATNYSKGSGKKFSVKSFGDTCICLRIK